MGKVPPIPPGPATHMPAASRALIWPLMRRVSSRPLHSAASMAACSTWMDDKQDVRGMLS